MPRTRSKRQTRNFFLFTILLVVIAGAAAAILLITLDRSPEDSTNDVPVADVAAMETPIDEEPPTVPAAPSSPSTPATGYRVGNRAPDFALTSLDGQTVTLSSYLGRVVILDFWASWCTPCRISMPDLYTLWKDHEDSGVVFLGVSLDRSESDAVAYIESKSYHGFVPLYGSYSAAANVARQYGVSGIPRTFVIDRSGVIRFADHPATLTAVNLATWL